jgi:hypothetical protein
MVANNPAAGGPDIYEKIIEALEKNGDLTAREFRRMVLFALVDLGKGRRDSRYCREQMDEMGEKLDELEKNSLILIAKKHSKITAAVLAVLGLFFVSVISRLELWGWIGEFIKELTGVGLP